MGRGRASSRPRPRTRSAPQRHAADARRASREIEEQTHHDVAAFVDAVAERARRDGRWFHYGLTSSDVVDTALALQLREAGGLILDGIDRALDAVVAPRGGAPDTR